MESMIERVARAICRSQTQSERMWQAFLPEATAAIEEMRVPTEGMVKTGSANIAPWWSPAMRNREDYGNTRRAARSAFSGMIDAALSE